MDTEITFLQNNQKRAQLLGPGLNKLTYSTYQMANVCMLITILLITDSTLWNDYANKESGTFGKEIQNPVLPGNLPGPTAFQIGDIH